MIKLSDVVDLVLLEEMVGAGYVRTQVHPQHGFLIYNYTEKAAYDGVWNDATLQCRGLIANPTNGEVLARPFRKFFNHGQAGAPTLALDTPVVVTDKADGSLAILFPAPDGGYAIATRGSFTSDQALHATRVWKDRYEGKWTPTPGYTFLFEIVYPMNRIVLRYSFDDLVMLGAVDIATGWSIPRAAEWSRWPGRSVEVFSYVTFAEALAAPPRENAEGLVVHVPATDDRVKLKYPEYVRLHRLVTGCTKKTVWRHAGCIDLAASGLDARQIAQVLHMAPAEVSAIVEAAPGGDWMASFIEAVPEEFEMWIRTTATELIAAVDSTEEESLAQFNALGVASLDRRAAAACITALPKAEQSALFSLLDGRTVRPLAWRSVQPSHETPFATSSEDVS